MEKLRISEAVTEADREAVYRLRYDIYVTDMGRRQHHADHSKRTVREPLDDRGHVFYAHTDSSVVGTIRINFRRDGELEQEDLYNMELFSPLYPSQVSMTTKFMVRREYRDHPTLAARLAQHTFRFAIEHGMLVDFIDTSPRLVRVYKRMGYRRYQHNIEHPEYGYVTPLVLLLDDVAYFERVGSPFTKIAATHFAGRESQTVHLCRRSLPDFAAMPPTFMLPDNEMLARLFPGNTGRGVAELVSLFRDFSEEEAFSVLRAATVLHADAGDVLLRSGGEAMGILYLLAGHCEIRSPMGASEPALIRELRRDEACGEMCESGSGKSTCTVTATERSKVMVISPEFLSVVESRLPHVAPKLYRNIARLLSDRLLLTPSSSPRTAASLGIGESKVQRLPEGSSEQARTVRKGLASAS